ncbi:alpha/beta fold hydrolase [Methylobacterium sp. J-030]|uniref:alpha/beta fold hydrolase n=1 Tax=Methylobacterium sp. J-030 TaxID=2836627 RepID=UPI001FB90090|nr:alpha/beta fold hydrolase [Methylobacterium sp. J-030]MCJ2072353.1 alpha/beta fold hydrolase [Methylobacterium sp. J-030]
MTPETRPASAPCPGLHDPTPVTFDGLFGWLHPAAGRRGVVLCGAYGFEQMAAYRPWRALAERLAQSGCPTLRFDYPGEGDSADPDATAVTACTTAIRQAVRFLRETAGVTEIVLVGLRLGAAFAALAAEAEPVDRLVLLAPVVTGRAYLREMRLRAQTIGRLPDGSAPAAEPEALTVGGFSMDAAFQAELSGLNLARIATPPAPRVLLLAPEPGGLGTRLGALGCAVETGPFAGLAHLVGDPIFVKVPEADFARISAYAAEGAAKAEATPPAVPPARLAGPGWSEAPTRFVPGLFGISCTPDRPEPGAPTILFVSTGMTVRSGWGRQTTRLARSLAAEGIASFRCDVAGVGDSVERPDGHWPLFAPDGFADVVRAVDHVAGGGPIVLVGGCSGAYAAFHALCRDPRIDGALLVNLYCFDWDPEQSVDSVIRQTYGSAATYAALLAQGDTWRRLIRGQIRVRAIGRVLARRGVDLALRRIRRAFRPGAPGGSVARRVATIRRRGAAIRLLYSAGDPGLAALRRHLGRTPDRSAARLGAPVTIVPGADHNLGSREAQAALGQAVRDLVRAVRYAPSVQVKRPAPAAFRRLHAATDRA